MGRLPRFWCGTRTKPAFRHKDMKASEDKKKLQTEIERARRAYFAAGRRVRYLAADDENAAQDVKPRKQRLKLLA